MTTDNFENGPCPDCQVSPGTRHQEGCDVARCDLTGTQWIQCGCQKGLPQIWTGVWPGVEQCRELNWFTEISGFEGPTEDLTRLTVVGYTYGWDKDNQKWKIPLERSGPRKK